jgi:hypothetical protein
VSTLPWSIGSSTQRMYDALQPVAKTDADQSWALLIFMDAIGREFQDVANLVEDDDYGVPGWSILLDPNRAPDEGLLWLAQLTGTKLKPAATPDAWRQQIRDHDNWDRGTVASIIKAIRNSGGLTGNQSVIIRERDTSAYHFSVLTYPNETVGYAQFTYANLYAQPTYNAVLLLYLSYASIYFSIGEWLVLQAILSQKPAGLQFNYSVAFPQDYYAIWNDFATYLVVYNSFATYQQIYDFNSPLGSGAPGGTESSVYAMLDSYLQLWNANQLYSDVQESYTRY